MNIKYEEHVMAVNPEHKDELDSDPIISIAILPEYYELALRTVDSEYIKLLYGMKDAIVQGDMSIITKAISSVTCRKMTCHPSSKIALKAFFGTGSGWKEAMLETLINPVFKQWLIAEIDGLFIEYRKYNRCYNFDNKAYYEFVQCDCKTTDGKNK